MGITKHVSPSEREMKVSIQNKLELGNLNIHNGNYGFAKQCYADVAALYEKIGDPENAVKTRGLAAKIGKGISLFKKEPSPHVYYLGSGLSSTASVASAFAIALGTLIILPKLTGNAIGTSGVGINLIGVVLFVVGVFGLYSSLKSRKK